MAEPERKRARPGAAAPDPLDAAVASIRSVIEQRVQQCCAERERDLERREQLVAEREHAMDRRERQMADAAARQAARVRLDIRGAKFSASRAALATEEGTFLHAMLGSERYLPDESGEYFIDRSPVYTIPILEYLCAAADVASTFSRGELAAACMETARRRGREHGHGEAWRSAFDDEVRFLGVQSLMGDEGCLRGGRVLAASAGAVQIRVRGASETITIPCVADGGVIRTTVKEVLGSIKRLVGKEVKQNQLYCGTALMGRLKDTDAIGPSFAPDCTLSISGHKPF